MIDTKELRRLVQAALAAPDGLSAEWMDRLGQFQEAADASVVSELLERLEAAEKSDAESIAMYRKARDERDALRAKIETAESDAAHQKALAESALRVAEGWERKCDELRARIEEMEKQEPYAFAVTFPESSRVELVHDLPEAYEDMIYEAYEVRKLYLAPGAKGEEK